MFRMLIARPPIGVALLNIRRPRPFNTLCTSTFVYKRTATGMFMKSRNNQSILKCMMCSLSLQKMTIFHNISHNNHCFKRSGHITSHDPTISSSSAAASSLSEENHPSNESNGKHFSKLSVKKQFKILQEEFLRTGCHEQATKMLETITYNWLERIRSKLKHHRTWRPYSHVAKQLRSVPSAVEVVDWISLSGIVPNVTTYQTLIEGATTKTEETPSSDDHAKLAHILLDRILERVAIDLQERSDSSTSLTYYDLSRSFRRVMVCYCHAQDILSAEDILTKLEQWQDQYFNIIGDLFPIKDTNYTILLNAWIEVGRPQQAEQVLHRMLQRAMRPDGAVLARRIHDSFENLLNAWASSHDQQAGQHAELLLAQMLHLGSSTTNDKSSKPTYTINSFSKAVVAWSNSRHPDAPSRTHELVRLVTYKVEWSTEQRESKNFRRTMASMYLTTMNLWSSSDDSQSPEKCHELLSWLDKSIGLHNVPNVMILQNLYANLLWAWARSDRVDLAEQAQQIFHHLECNRVEGGLFATVVGGWCLIIYTALLRIAAKSGDGDLAETLLKRMMIEYTTSIHPPRTRKAPGVESIETTTTPASPLNLLNVNEVLIAWSRCKFKAHAARRAEKLFCQIFTSSHASLKPDTVAYTALLTAMIGSTTPVEAARGGEQYLRQYLMDNGLMSNSNNMNCTEPIQEQQYADTVLLYTRVIALWSRVLTAESMERVGILWDEMKGTDLIPSPRCYQIYRSMLQHQNKEKNESNDAEGRLHELDIEMKKYWPKYTHMYINNDERSHKNE